MPDIELPPISKKGNKMHRSPDKTEKEPSKPAAQTMASINDENVNMSNLSKFPQLSGKLEQKSKKSSAKNNKAMKALDKLIKIEVKDIMLSY